jgi:glucose/arabinose dehydrogenase
MRRAAVVMAGVLALSGCAVEETPDGGAREPAPTSEAGSLEVVSSGWSNPWGLVEVNGGLLISERGGSIWFVDESGERREVLDVPGVTPRGEGGLLGLEVSDDERTVFAYATRGDVNEVLKMSWDGTSLGDPEVVVTGIKAGSTHNGGRLRTGPGGMLYVGTGDAQDREAAQDPQSLNGKVLRVNPDGSVPADNPDPGSLVLTLGHRNVQGLAFAADGTLWASEFGQDEFDELNVLVPGGNYGWPEVEGRGGDSRFEEPEVVWAPEDASPSGITVLGAEVLVGALRGERVWRVPSSGSSAGEPLSTLEGELGRVRALEPRTGGGAWVLTDNGDGEDVVARLG